MNIQQYQPKKHLAVIDHKTRTQLANIPLMEGQVVVHCIVKAGPNGNKIRIQPTTYLVPQGGKPWSKLVQAYNIGIYPDWHTLPPDEICQFTLLLTPLPDDCTCFDLFEEFHIPGYLQANNILRNQEDIYYIIMDLSEQ